MTAHHKQGHRPETASINLTHHTSFFFFFFFERRRDKSVNTRQNQRPSYKTRVTGIPDHFSSGWGWTIKSLGSTILQERLGESPRTRASQYHASIARSMPVWRWSGKWEVPHETSPVRVVGGKLASPRTICLPLHLREQPVWLFHVHRRVLDTLALSSCGLDAKRHRLPKHNDCAGCRCVSEVTPKWWPLGSSGWPHRQKREEGGRGSQRWQKSST